ncbi:MAG TPA: S8/S53 family peptidase, partial [Saprospiraceae bacterium]|nr:S8/S53 family peptidase [Saprospiraceae bacterium]
DGKSNGIFTDAFKTIVDSGEWRNLTQTNALLERLRTFFRYPKPNYMAYGEGLPVFEQNFPLLADLPSASGRIQSPAPTAQAADLKPGAPPTSEASQSAQPYYKIRIEWPDGVLTPALVQSLCPAGSIRTEIQTNGESAVVWFPGAQFPSVWEPVHHIARQADKQRLPLVVEPVAVQATPLQPDAAEAKAAEDEYGYLPYWPPVTEQQDPPMGWHLDDDHSQLASARDFVWDKLRSGEVTENVRIGHLDTGWYPTHPGFASNPNIRRDLTRTFVDKEKGINQAAIDLQYKGGEQQGHGSGTLGVLACWSLDPQYTGGTPMGYLGAIPFAEVVPIRIADSVLIFDTENFCEGLEYAMEIGCEVVSMSMGGKPSRRMAKTINRAYEKGITIVTAAGNNMAKGLAGIGPKIVVWPARYQRVLAACGACHNHIPYDFAAQDKYATKIKMSDYRYMQGNWGPKEAMHKALAAYSPNITWVIRDEREAVRKRGGGTSAVTPQIAAAAAMWITLHKAELKKRGYAGTWKQVEAVRRALFQTADQSFVESKKYYGNGILRAKQALEYGVPDISDDMKAEKADSTLFGLNEALRLFLDRHRATETPGPALQQSLELELQHLLLDDEKATGNDEVNPGDAGQVLGVVKRGRYVSEDLRVLVGE